MENSLTMASTELDQHLVNLRQIYPAAYHIILNLLEATKNLQSSLNQTQEQLDHHVWTNHKLKQDLKDVKQTLEQERMRQKETAGNIVTIQPLDLSIKSRNPTIGGTGYFPSTMLECDEAARFSDQNRIQRSPCQRQGRVDTFDQNPPSFIPARSMPTGLFEIENNWDVPPQPSSIENINEPDEECSQPDCLLHNHFENVQGSFSFQPFVADGSHQSTFGRGTDIQNTTNFQAQNSQREIHEHQNIDGMPFSQTCQAPAPPTEEFRSVNVVQAQVNTTNFRQPSRATTHNGQHKHGFSGWVLGKCICSCKSSFFNMKNLHQHIKRATFRNFHCETCGKDYHYLHEKKTHQQKQHMHRKNPEKEWGCTRCGMIFKTQSRCNLHHYRAHGPMTGRYY